MPELVRTYTAVKSVRRAYVIFADRDIPYTWFIHTSVAHKARVFHTVTYIGYVHAVSQHAKAIICEE